MCSWRCQTNGEKIVCDGRVISSTKNILKMVFRNFSKYNVPSKWIEKHFYHGVESTRKHIFVMEKSVIWDTSISKSVQCFPTVQRYEQNQIIFFDVFSPSQSFMYLLSISQKYRKLQFLSHSTFPKQFWYSNLIHRFSFLKFGFPRITFFFYAWHCRQTQLIRRDGHIEKGLHFAYIPSYIFGVENMTNPSRVLDQHDMLSATDVSFRSPEQ